MTPPSIINRLAMAPKQDAPARAKPDLPNKDVQTPLAVDPRAKKGPTVSTGLGTSLDGTTYPSGLRLGLIITSVLLSMFLVSLDRLIIATAIPRITDEFHSVTDIGWYGSAYLLTSCAFQLLFGKIYSLFNIRTTFLTAILFFEVGSAVSGTAPNSIAFIIGRAIAGLGAAGIYSGGMAVFVVTIPLHKRPVFQGLFGAVFGVSSIAGPLLGGAFTSNVSWRWCFYINLPLGGVAMAVIFLLLQVPKGSTKKTALIRKLTQLDLCGTAVLVPGTICLILSLDWGGSMYPWNSVHVVALLVVAGLLFVMFAMVQIFLHKTGTLPPRVLMKRSIIAGAFSSLCIGSHQMIFSYYIPVWFQAIQGASAMESGIRILPLLLSVVVSSILTGVLIRHSGYYTPFLITGVCFTSAGAGLLTTLRTNTSEAQWIGYQILYGWGLGCTSQVPSIAAQAVLPKTDVSVGISLMFFSQLLGGAVFLSVGQNVLNSQLLYRLSSLPGFNPGVILRGGVTSVAQLPAEIRRTILPAYNEALRHVFLVGLVLACITTIGASAMEWRSLKKKGHETMPSDIQKQTPKGPSDTGKESGLSTNNSAEGAADEVLNAKEDTTG